MPTETYRIRIRKDGTVLLQTRELSAQRLRELREMLEDCLGPVREIRQDNDEPSVPEMRAPSETDALFLGTGKAK